VRCLARALNLAFVANLLSLGQVTFFSALHIPNDNSMHPHALGTRPSIKIVCLIIYVRTGLFRAFFAFSGVFSCESIFLHLILSHKKRRKMFARLVVLIAVAMLALSHGFTARLSSAPRLASSLRMATAAVAVPTEAVLATVSVS